jgi:LPXTG-motif cell wall-anchored protein
MDECHPSSPGLCVDNPATPADECGFVSPPGTPPGTTTGRTPGETPPGSTVPPGTNAGPVPAVSTTSPAAQEALPNTGAPSGLLVAGIAGLLLVLVGAGVVATRRTTG